MKLFNETLEDLINDIEIDNKYNLFFSQYLPMIPRNLIKDIMNDFNLRLQNLNKSKKKPYHNRFHYLRWQLFYSIRDFLPKNLNVIEISQIILQTIPINKIIQLIDNPADWIYTQV